MKDFSKGTKLARDCVTMTLHGPLPLKTSMRLAETILEMDREYVEAIDHLTALANHPYCEGSVLNARDYLEEKG